MLKQYASDLRYFEGLSMRELYDCLKSWQDKNKESFLNLNIQKEGDKLCCVAVVVPVEVQGIEDDIPKFTDGSMVFLTIEEMKDLVLWYSNAKRWFLKGKGCAVDWENKHLREEIALPIRHKLANAKNVPDIMDAFDLRKAKPSSENEA